MLKSKGTISNIQKDALLVISRTSGMDRFCLAGGTALADYYLAHRKSFDLDIFAGEKDIVLPFSADVTDNLKKDFLVSVTRRFPTFVELEVSRADEKTKIQFAYDSPFKLEEPSDSDAGMKIRSFKDLISDKMLAFFGRVEPRDAVDLFFIFKTEDVWKIAELAAQKDTGFDLYWLAIALRKAKHFPDNIAEWPVELLKPLDATDLKALFSNLEKTIMEKIKGGSKNGHF